MFRKPNPHTIESDTGFSVEQVAHNTLIYRERDRQTTCTLEYYGRGAVLGIVYLGEFTHCWDPPSDKVEISDEDWKRIADNIREAFRAEGLEVDTKVMSLEGVEALKLAIEQLKQPSSQQRRKLTPEDRKMVERVFAQMKRPLPPSVATGYLASVKRILERLKRSLSRRG